MLPKKIHSLQHPIVKHLAHLRTSRRYRQQEKRLVVFGSKLVSELKPKRLFLSPNAPLEQAAGEVFFLEPALFKKISGQEHPELIAAEVEMPEESPLTNASYLLALDNVSDPGNVGTLIRTALALGWEGIFLTDGCADPFNDKALSAAKGATFRLPFNRGSREELLALIKEHSFTPLAADTIGAPLSTLNPSPPLILILGSEGCGIAPELKALSTLVTIPMSGRMESLNVAAAGAILMHGLKK